MAAELLAAAATIASVASVAPQVRRTCRHRDVAGVSVAACALGAVSELYWVVYAVGRDRWGAVPVAAAMAAGNLVMVAALVLHGAQARRAATAAAWWGTLLAIVLVRWGAVGLGVVLAGAYLVQAGPTIWTILHSERVGGVAPARWRLVGGEGVLWAAYGCLNDDGPITVLGMVLAVTAGVVLHRAGRVGAVAVSPAGAGDRSSGGDVLGSWLDEPAGRGATNPRSRRPVRSSP